MVNENHSYQIQNQQVDPKLGKSHSVFLDKGVDDFFEQYSEKQEQKHENQTQQMQRTVPKLMQNPTFGKTNFVEDLSGGNSNLNSTNQSINNKGTGLNFSKGYESKKIGGDKKRFQRDNFNQGYNNKDRDYNQGHVEKFDKYANMKNVSQYRNDRIFNNEKIKKNDVYYFAKNPLDYENLKNSNPNII